MNEIIKNVMDNLKLQLKENQEQCDWHHKKFKEYELKLIHVKSAITELNMNYNNNHGQQKK